MDSSNNPIEQLSQHFDQIGLVKELSSKLNVPSAYLVIGTIFTLFILVAFGLAAPTFCNLVGIIYPAYMSFKAIESEGKEDDKQWLTYWVVFGLYAIVDNTGLFADLIPFYYPFKLIILVALFWPKSRGAEKLYDAVVKTAFTKLTEAVENAFPDDEAARKTRSKLQ